MSGEESPDAQQQQGDAEPPAGTPLSEDRGVLTASESGERGREEKPPAHHLPTRPIEWLQLCINGGLALIAIGALCIYHGQLGTMKDQLAEMQAQRRPWISIETAALYRFSFQRNGPGLRIDAHSWVELSIRNTGQTPALHIRSEGRIVSMPHARDPIAQSRAVCDEVDKSRDRDVTAFPGTGGTRIRSHAGWDAVEELHKAGDEVNLIVYGCLRYEDSLRIPHHTGFTFDLYKPIPASHGLIGEGPITVIEFGTPPDIVMSPNWSGFVTFAD